MLRILSVAGTDCNVADYDSRSALHLSVCNGCMDALKFLLELKGINVCSVRCMKKPCAVHATRVLAQSLAHEGCYYEGWSITLHLVLQDGNVSCVLSHALQAKPWYRSSKVR
jgi:hypothetical protein